jgi:hypothetical protein
MTQTSQPRLTEEILRLIRTKCALAPETKVYRICDFFSAVDAFDSGRLKLTRVSTYPDGNEGVDRLVRGLVVAGWGPGCGPKGAHDLTTARKLVADERQCRFVSCWSRSVESHALWEVYSSDKSAVRVQTTVGLLQQACASALAEGWEALFTSGPESRFRAGPLVCEAEVLEVCYEDLRHLLSRLSRRTRLARRLVKDHEFRIDRHKGNRLESKWQKYLKPSFLKDDTFAHEREIRISVRFGWETLMGSGKGFDQCVSVFHTARSGSIPHLDDLAMLVRAAGNAPEALMPTAYAAPLPAEFIQSACVDPRAAEYKRSFMEAEFRRRGVPVVRSSALDLAVEGLDTFPD